MSTKRENLRLNLYDAGYPWGGPNHIAFGFREPWPFHDERVRRALSMVIDRDLWISGNYDVDLFESAGLPVDTRWNNHFSADDKTYWIDPQGTGLGEGAAFFQYDPEEATRLMRAVGHDGPLAIPGQMSGTGNNQIASLHGMIQESGLFDVSLVSPSAGDHATTVWNGSGDFEGIAMAQNMGVRGDIDQYLSTRWSPGGASGTQSMFPEVYPWYQKAPDLITPSAKSWTRTAETGSSRRSKRSLLSRCLPSLILVRRAASSSRGLSSPTSEFSVPSTTSRL